MKRVLRPGGILFLSFPSFNPFRQARATKGKYDSFNSSPCSLPDFYQFALKPTEVTGRLNELGFELLDHCGTGSLQGFAEDLAIFGILKKLLEYFPSRLETATSMAMDLGLGQYAGHSSLLILKKRKAIF